MKSARTLKRYSPRKNESYSNAVRKALREMRLAAAEQLTDFAFEARLLFQQPSSSGIQNILHPATDAIRTHLVAVIAAGRYAFDPFRSAEDPVHDARRQGSAT